MDTRIVYLMSGPGYLPYLVVSLYCLRKHWEGEIDVYGWPESHGTLSTIAEDKRLGVHAHLKEQAYRGKNSQFLSKIILAQEINCPRAIYLDADTMPVGPLDDIIDLLDDSPLVPTQFNNWLSCEGMPRGRLEWLLGREAIPQGAVQRALTENLPSVNGGVFGFWPGSQILSIWEKYTRALIDLFIADEVVLHALVAEYWNSQEVKVVCGGHVNCSPKFQPKYLPDDLVSVWHGHGSSFSRPQKSPKAVSLWWPVYRECLEENIGGIADWKDQHRNRHLKALEETPQENCIYCWGDSTLGHQTSCPRA